MNCPKCGAPNCRFKQKRSDFHGTKKTEKFKRTDFTAECKKCGWEGKI